jgi:hypothetical protein
MLKLNYIIRNAQKGCRVNDIKRNLCNVNEQKLIKLEIDLPVPDL